MRREQPRLDPYQIRPAYREPGEVPDERPVIVREPFWTDPSEQLTYAHAVESNKIKPDESPFGYIQRIASIVRQRMLVAVKPMPKVVADDARLQRLRAQAKEIGG